MSTSEMDEVGQNQITAVFVGIFWAGDSQKTKVT
jgi:hypothetical protein